MKNYKLIIQYDGTGYAGWQIQDNAKSVQETVTGAIETITKEKINLIGSGRTDTGVHAFGQAANFRLEKDLDPYRFMHSMNAILPQDISIKSTEETTPEFHSRFDAKKRSYLYFISRSKNPFTYKYSWNYHGPADIVKLNQLSRYLQGEHDFTSFSRKKSEVNNRLCTIYDAHWRESGDFIIFFIEANRFLHGMVRTTVGTLLRGIKLNWSGNDIIKVLEEKDRETAGEAIPAKGLFLYKVKY
ncbi:MAG: tRNA pseudouridine(38-40) synthase TruA [Syntrophothermus sp.]